MPLQRPDAPDAELLKSEDAKRILQRASELDASRATSAAVSELRAAATEAGISPAAFDAALAEHRAGRTDEAVEVRKPRVFRSMGFVIGAIATLMILFGAVIIPRLVVSSRVDASIAETRITLRCIATGTATEAARAILGSTAIVSVHPGPPATMTIRASPAEVEQVQKVIRDHEAAANCAVPPVPR